MQCARKIIHINKIKITIITKTNKEIIKMKNKIIIITKVIDKTNKLITNQIIIIKIIIIKIMEIEIIIILMAITTIIITIEIIVNLLIIIVQEVENIKK